MNGLISPLLFCSVGEFDYSCVDAIYFLKSSHIIGQESMSKYMWNTSWPPAEIISKISLMEAKFYTIVLH